MWARGMRELTGLAISIPQIQSEYGSVRKIIHICFLYNVNIPFMDFCFSDIGRFLYLGKRLYISTGYYILIEALFVI